MNSGHQTWEREKSGKNSFKICILLGFAQYYWGCCDYTFLKPFVCAEGPIFLCIELLHGSLNIILELPNVSITRDVMTQPS